MLHHFVDEQPRWGLYGKDSGIHYRHLSMVRGLEWFLETIAAAGYRITIPKQGSVDALLHEITGPYNWHYESPVHKRVLTARDESLKGYITRISEANYNSEPKSLYRASGPTVICS